MRIKKRTKRKVRKLLLIIAIIGIINIVNYYDSSLIDRIKSFALPSYDISEVPDYNGRAYVTINNNNPNFSKEEITTKTFEKYSNLDILGRCGVAYANISIDTMPKEERKNIGMIKPTGWKYSKYDFIDGKYLYNRCHLIGFQLAGENDNKKNLITCTRFANATTMLKFENKVSDYVKKTKNHVLYRVTPIFNDMDLVAKGIQMEALSVEDNGQGIKFNVYVYNVQEGVTIDYRTGENHLTNQE